MKLLIFNATLGLVPLCSCLYLMGGSGILWVDELFYDNLLKPLESLLTEFNLPKSALYVHQGFHLPIQMVPSLNEAPQNHLAFFIHPNSCTQGDLPVL